MKIVFTVNKYNPNLDGVQFVTNYLAEGLVAKGHDVFLVTTSYTVKPSPESETLNGVKIIRLPIFTKHTFHHGDKKKYIKIIGDLCKDAACLINVGTQVAFTDWCFKILDKIKCMKVLYIHSIRDFKYKKSDFLNFKRIPYKIFNNIRWRLYYSFNGYNFKKYNKIVQLHEKDYAVKFFETKYGIKSNVIYNAVDNEFFSDSNKQSCTDSCEKYAIYVANFLERKNQIKAIKLFCEANEIAKTDYKLMLVGSEKSKYYYEMVEFLKKNNYSEQIILKVGIDRKSTIELIKKSKFVFMSSNWEAFPISLIEGMACGKPFISTDVGVVKYFPGGFVGDDEYVKYRLIKFLQDDEIINNYGIICKRFALENFCISAVVDKIEQLIFQENILEN